MSFGHMRVVHSHYLPPGGKALSEINNSMRPQESPDLQMWFYLTEAPQALCTTQVINANYEMSVSHWLAKCQSGTTSLSLSVLCEKKNYRASQVSPERQQGGNVSMLIVNHKPTAVKSHYRLWGYIPALLRKTYLCARGCWGHSVKGKRAEVCVGLVAPRSKDGGSV